MSKEKINEIISFGRDNLSNDEFSEYVDWALDLRNSKCNRDKIKDKDFSFFNEMLAGLFITKFRLDI